jgi:predicted RNA binding protein YcfA (HicA-like mRNA interferase family)
VGRLRRLSGQDVIDILASFGFEPHSRRGSHVKLHRLAASLTRETLTVPDHKELDSGTCRAILRQASRYIPLDDLRPHFYAE